MNVRGRWLIFALACAVACVAQAEFDSEIHRSFRAQATFVVAAGVPLVLMAAWAYVGWASQRRTRRTAAGHCARCGYDLTGNVSGACPECGTRAGGAE